MLNYYIEIQLQPDEEIPATFLMSKAYMVIHKALAKASTDGACPIGTAFPQMDEKTYDMGNVIRLFAEDKATLESLHLSKMLSNLSDYLMVSSVRPVRAVKGYASYSKVHFPLTKSKIRRYARYRGLTDEEASKMYKTPEHENYPGIRLRSTSTAQDYVLFIHKESYEQPNDGLFSTMGLSSKTGKITVPVFR